MATLAPPPRLSPPARSPRRLPRRRRTGEAARLWRRVFRRVLDHECSEVAGEMAFDFSLSIFPAALFLAALVGPMGITPEHVSQALNVLGIFLHEMVREMVEENVRNLVAAQSQKVLTIGLLGAVWASSSAISATIKALNRANGVREARAFWYRRLLSVGLVLSGGVGLIVSFNLLIMGTWIEEELLARLGFGVPLTITILKWPVGFLGAVVMACLLYRIAPNCQPRLRELLPGSLLFAFLWFFLSKGFGYYVGHFSYYNKVYGILGGFIALLVWIYLTALILLIGGELNAELARGKKAAAEAPS